MFFTLRRFYSLLSLRWYPETYKNVFILLSLLWIVFYVIILFRLWNDALFYLDMLNYYYRLYMAGILLYFFNPWGTVGMDSFHRSLIFSTALYLIASTTITDFVKRTKEVTVKAKEDAEKLIERVASTTPASHTPSLTAFL
jgi:hypothetical protein